MSNLDPVFNGYQPKNDKKDLSMQDHNLQSRTHKEDEYLNKQLDSDSQIEKKYHAERAIHEQASWNNFQLAASSIAQLYKDKATDGRDEQWFSFQNAAEHATVLYRESLEGYKAYGDLSAQYGYSRRNKELIHWLRRKRKTIKRDELVKFLCGRTSPPYRGYLPLTHGQVLDRDNRMQTFREAVCLGGLNNKMSGINFDGGQGSPRANPQQDLSSFLHEQFKQASRSSSPSRKRSASISGTVLDQTSPKRKR